MVAMGYGLRQKQIEVEGVKRAALSNAVKLRKL